MNAYGKAALAAAQDCERNHRSPTVAWSDAVKKEFPKSKRSQEKCCPRGAFLGLCEAGLVRGVPRGDYIGPTLNAQYAIAAVTQLWKEPSLANDALKLWRRVTPGLKTPNQQMNVVIALWEKCLLPHSKDEKT
ncbi:MAG TPA: hypothetical protein VIK35_00500 [Verrucomicrobiae bacterium]